MPRGFTSCQYLDAIGWRYPRGIVQMRAHRMIQLASDMLEQAPKMVPKMARLMVS